MNLAVHMPPGEDARIIETNGSLESMQALVGGWISVVGRLRDRYVVFGDEEARLKWHFDGRDVSLQPIQPNRWLGGEDILGPMVVVRLDEKSLTGLEAVLLCQELNALPRVAAHEVRKPTFAVIPLEIDP